MSEKYPKQKSPHIWESKAQLTPVSYHQGKVRTTALNPPSVG